MPGVEDLDFRDRYAARERNLHELVFYERNNRHGRNKEGTWKSQEICVRCGPANRFERALIFQLSIPLLRFFLSNILTKENVIVWK